MDCKYKLIGDIWDGRPCAALTVEAKPLTIYSCEVGTPKNLFDADYVRRWVGVSKLFSVNRWEDFILIGLLVRECDEVDLLLDYLPAAYGSISKDFYWKRLNQIVSTLKEIAPDTELVLVKHAPLDEICGEAFKEYGVAA